MFLLNFWGWVGIEEGHFVEFHFVEFQLVMKSNAIDHFVESLGLLTM